MADECAPRTAALHAAAPTTGRGARPLRIWVWIAALALFAVTFGIMYSLVPSRHPMPREREPQSARPGPEPLIESVAAQKPRNEGAGLNAPLSADALFKRVSPAVVKVVILDRQGRDIGSGSGFLVGTHGLIATNHHVIARAEAASVFLSDKTKLTVAGVAAMDEAADIAILKIANQMSVQPLKLAGTDLPPVGEKVYAIGTPFGFFANSLSDGLVSGHREIDRLTMIQTTASISPGSSGGPLLASDGTAIGMTTAAFRGGQNINVAIPASQIAKVLVRCIVGKAELMHFPLAGQGDGPSESPKKQAAPSGPFVLSPDQQKKCETLFSYYANNYGVFQGTVYNGTDDLIITRVVFVLYTTKWKREYTVIVNVRPQDSQPIFINVDDPRLPRQAVEVKSMKGISIRP